MPHASMPCSPLLTRLLASALGASVLLLTAAQAQTYHAGAGLTLTGTTFSVANGGVTGAMIGLPLSLTASSGSPILTVTNTGSGYGIKTVSTTGTGTYGTNTKYGNVGTLGDINGFGVYGSTAAGPYPYGVYGVNRTSGNGDYGILGGVEPISGSKYPVGVFGSDASSSANGSGVYGSSKSGSGVVGLSSTSSGVVGLSSTSSGGSFLSASGNGAAGVSSGGGYGVYGSSNSGTGIRGISTSSYGGHFSSTNGNGVLGTSGGSGYGLSGVSASGSGVSGSSTSGDGVDGTSSGSGVGVSGSSTSGSGVFGTSGSGPSGYFTGGGTDGVLGVTTARGGNGIEGECDNGVTAYGVYGHSSSGYGVVGVTNSASGSIGVLGTAPSGSYAGYFSGDVSVTGTLSAGVKNFKIDHPLDPEHKYLTHASIESDEMTNLYSGNVTTDASGNATVAMPSWFQALNTDFRYQLTCIGQFAQAIVATKVKDNQFTIKTDKPNVEVSWMVTGVRHDAFALAHPLEVEQDKPEYEQGLYQNPEAFGQPESMGLGYARKQKRLHLPILPAKQP